MENLDELRKRQEKVILAENNPLQLYPETLDALLALNFPPKEWLIEGLLPAQALTILSGASNSYKTWLMLQMALNITQGKRLFGELETRAANVLIVDEESQPNGLYERFKQLQVPDGLPIWWLSRRLHKITDEGYLDSIISRCAALNIELVIFDSLTRMHSGEENSVRDMSKVMEAFKTLTDFGVAVLIAHHTRKDVAGSYNPDNSMRGSSDILAAIDCHITMRRSNPNSNYVEVRQTKNRFSEPMQAVKLRFGEVNDGHELLLAEWLKKEDDRTDELKAAILQAIASEPGIYKKLLSTRLREKNVDIEERKLAALLKELVSEGKIIIKPGERTKIHYFIADESSVAETQ
jgi:RecA-family ATPase